MTGPSAALTTREQHDLETFEEIVDRGIQTFIEVGRALAEIRDRRLYRDSDSTFGAYCRERWAFSDSRARQLIAAAEVVTEVTVDGLPAPQSERVARELVSLRAALPESYHEAWAGAVKKYGPEPTGKQVREVKLARSAERRREKIRGIEQAAETRTEAFQTAPAQVVAWREPIDEAAEARLKEEIAAREAAVATAERQVTEARKQLRAYRAGLWDGPWGRERSAKFAWMDSQPANGKGSTVQRDQKGQHWVCMPDPDEPGAVVVKYFPGGSS